MLDTRRPRSDDAASRAEAPKSLAAPGSDREFQQFAAAFAPVLFSSACTLLHDAYFAEDVVQETLLRTFRQWPQARSAPEAYSHVTLMNVCRDHWRRLRRRPKEVPTDPCEARTQEHPDGWEDDWAEREAIEEALTCLGVQQRQVLIIRFILGFSVAETAELLGIAVGTVKSSTHRALRQLHAALQEPEPDTRVGADEFGGCSDPALSVA